LALGIPKGVDAGLAAAVGAPPGDEVQRHFAREIHDQLAQPLITLVLEIRELKAALGPSPLVQEVAALEERARGILRQAREMMVDLRQRGDLRVNLLHALNNDVPVPAGRDLFLQITTRWPREVNGWAAFNLLRIVQQAAANAWRHGRARKVDVILDVGPSDEAVVVVLDDGVGIEDSPFGFGMAGMQERAAILGGRVSAQPREAGGTRVEVRFPLERLA
jgi:two-component system sensor histidine kinase UhpB